jgi:hypothetical protein
MDALMSTQLQNPSADQQENFVNALSQVLIKATGNPSIMSLPLIRASLPGISNTVKSFSTLSDPSHPTQQILEVTFDPNAISQLLRSAGQPMWDKERPVTLIWLSINLPNGKNAILGSDAASTEPVAIALKNSAQQRGLNVFFPLLDLSDQSLVSNNLDTTSPLTTADMQTLANRYHVQSVLAGTLTQVGHQWQTQWRYVLDSAPISWSQDPASTQDTAQQVIDTVASTMIAQLAISTTSDIQSQAYLTITQVNNLQMYSQLSHCLSSISSINSLSAMDLNKNQVTFRVNFSGLSDGLIQTISKPCNLTFQANAPDPVLPTTPLMGNKTQTTLPTLNFIYHGDDSV